MAQFIPSDQPARDRIENDLDVTLFAETGAGTGKTHLLVRRILRLLATGRAEPQSLAAITFTEKAAAELRDRVRQALETAAQDGSDLTPDERERCRVALSGLDAAALSTLHGFAQRLLAAYPLEAGLPPLVDVQDDVRSTIAFHERWTLWLDGFLSDPTNEDLVTKAVLLGLTLDQLKGLAEQFHQHWDRLETSSFPRELPPFPGASDLDELITLLEAGCAQRDGCRDDSDRLRQHLTRIEPYVGRLKAAETGADRLRLLATSPRLSTKGGNAGNWPRGAPAAIRGWLVEAEDARTAILQGMKGPLLFALMDALRGFIIGWAQERRQAGELHFQDLLVLARDLLRDNPDVRTALRSQYSHLLIDEFQDTDPLQAEIAVLLAADDHSSGHWQDLAVAEGRLFFVGDPKQSIYRFRGADIELYMTMKERFATGEVTLSQNFRSVPGILAWANHVFTGLMQSENPRAQASYVPLEATRQADESAVRVIGGQRDGNSEEVRQEEAKAIAQVILTAKAAGWHVCDPDLVQRPVTYADMAILIPTRTSLFLLQRALENEGIPYRVESRSLVYATAEVRDLLSVLAAIDDPTDQVALIAALRSPIYACSDDDLLRFRQAGGHWDYRSSIPQDLAPGHPVSEAYSSLAALHLERAWQGISGTVEQVVRERRLFELAFAHPRPRDVWNRLRFIVDQARAFQEAGGSTLRQFVEWAERQAEEDRAIVEIVTPERDDDAVRIMTVHAAKGLEFPIVVLAGLGSRPNPPARTVKVLWQSLVREGHAEAEGHVAEVQIGRADDGFSTPGFQTRQEHEEAIEAYERVRLLYVAATRARDHLVVSLFHPAKADTSHAAGLLRLCQAAPDLWQPVEWAEAPVRAHAAASFEDTPDHRAAWLAGRTALLTTPAAGRPIAATAIARALMPGSDAQGLDKEPPVEEAPPWKRGRAGTNFGRAVHSVLQSIDLATGDGLGSLARAQSAAEGVAARAVEVERLVKNALQAPSVREAVDRGRYWREVYVSAALGDVVVEGFSTCSMKRQMAWSWWTTRLTHYRRPHP